MEFRTRKIFRRAASAEKFCSEKAYTREEEKGGDKTEEHQKVIHELKPKGIREEERTAPGIYCAAGKNGGGKKGASKLLATCSNSGKKGKGSLRKGDFSKGVEHRGSREKDGASESRNKEGEPEQRKTSRRLSREKGGLR